MSAVSGESLGTFPDARTVRLERLLPAAVETVWGAITRPEELRRWLAVTRIELAVGGAAEFQILLAEDKPSSTVLRGVVGELDPPRLLTYSWDDPRAGGDTWVTWELEARGASTRVTLTQKGVGDGGLARNAAGWHVFLARLEAHLGKEPLPAFADLYSEAFPLYDERALAVGRQVRGDVTASRDVLLQTELLEAATGFYGGVLGMEVVMRREGLVGFEAGAFRLYVERGTRPGPVFELLVPDVAAMKEKLVARGCEVVEEDPSVPRCYLRDPFGLVFNLAER